MLNKEKLKKNIHLMIPFMLIFTMIFVMSYYMTYNPDEFNYSNITWTDTRINSISDILASQKILYFNWTGRVFVHFLIQLILYANHIFYPILNSIIFCVFIYTILKLANVRINYVSVLGCFALVWIFTPVFGETVIWLSGSLNYLWSVTILFLMLVMYKNIDKVNNYFLIILLSFLAGFTHENAAFLGASVLFYTFLIDRNNFKKKLTSIFSFFLGTAFLLLAPGNFNRAGGEGTAFTIDVFANIFIQFIIYTIIFIVINKEKVQKKVNGLLNKQIKYRNAVVYILSFLYLTLFIYRDWRSSNFETIIKHPQELLFKLCFIFLIITIIKTNDFKKSVQSYNLIIIAIVSLLPMKIMSGGIVERSYFAYTAMFLVAIIRAIKNINCNNIKRIGFITVIIMTLPTLGMSLKFYSVDLAQWSNKLNDSVDKFHKEGSNIALIEKQPIPSRIISTRYINAPSPLLSNANAITNFYTARYYKFDDVIGISPNCVVVKVSIDSGNKNDLTLDVTIDNNIVPHGNDNWLIEPSREDKNSKEVYFEFPMNATKFDIKAQNGSEFKINRIDIYTEEKSSTIFNAEENDSNVDINSKDYITIKNVWNNN